MQGKRKWRGRLRKHGYLKRSRSNKSRLVLNRRRRKGRARLTVQKKKK